MALPRGELYLRTMPDAKTGTASFGNRDVPADEKAGMIKDVFSSVASKYDLMNDLMSGGVHRIWKDMFVDWLNPQPGWRVLDVAGGTGDVAYRIAERVKKKGGAADIIISDINFDMLKAGTTRPEASADGASFAWLCADGERMPVADGSCDAFTIAFGIRNVTHIERVLEEAFRVLKPGGRFLCLEFSRVTAPGLDDLYDAYSFSVLPRLGELVAGDADAYRYLAESIRRFPAQEPFAKMIATAGFANVKVRNLAMGIAAIHSGWKV
jgi:demethylmenaquinone methyltransferase/2-methoxy-6-polyprenyl-1,4-benzoquinol methylase